MVDVKVVNYLGVRIKWALRKNATDTCFNNTDFFARQCR